jgi:methylated-DNA-protein-cysteine methyltransferase-like protein
MGYFDAVRRTVCHIPRGMVATYGDVAKASGYPGTARQVAWALRFADAQGIPWQRVLGSGGRVLLPDRAGEQQRRLLEREGVRFVGGRVDMELHAFHFSPGRRRHYPGKSLNK